MKIGVSACLLGHNVRYDGHNKKDEELINLLKDHEVIPICPELSAGFTIPRPAIELRENKAINTNGEDLTACLQTGARLCLEKIKDCDLLILKSRSPSCSPGYIYDGTFNHILIPGNGIFAQMAIDRQIPVCDETKAKEILKL